MNTHQSTQPRTRTYWQLFADAEDVIRGEAWVRRSDRYTLRRLLLVVAVFGMAYGAMMGSFGWLTFGGLGSDRPWQVVYSAVKVPMLLTVTFGICVPSFFVANTLFGLRTDFGASLRALVAAQAAIATVLVAIAPLTVFWYLSNADYNQAILFNVAVFAVSSFAGQFVLRRHYSELIEKDAKHRKLLYVWIVIYAFVGVQMGWILRPFIGSQDQAVQFLRPEAWDNAYVRVFALIWEVVT